MSDTIMLAEVLTVMVMIGLNFFIELLNTSFDNVNLNAIKNSYDDQTEIRDEVEVLLLLLESPWRYYYSNKLFNIVFPIVSGYIMLGPLSDQWFIGVDHFSFIGFKVIVALGLVVIYTSIGIYLPRKIGLQHSESIAISLSKFQNTLCILMSPLTWLIMLIANIMLKLFRQKTDVEEKVFSEEDVMSMLEVGQESGAIKEEGKKMINSIFAFDDELAYEIMTPRTDVFLIDINDSPDEYLDQLMELRYSRIPVCEDDTDNIIGILNIKDYLIKARESGFDNIEIRPILRKAYFVPETKNIDTLFVEMQKSRQQIAILIDEYGGFSGIVTMEDIIEEVMGDIDDEYDLEDHVIKPIGPNEYIIDGNVDLDDINEELDIDLESENSETISGFLIDILGEIPEEGTKKTITYNNYKFLIISIKERRIDKLKLTII